MKLSVLSSGSQANGYILQNDTCALIIEAGVKKGIVLESLGFNLSKVAACLVTHEHGDHAAYVNQYLNAAIPVYCSSGTAEAIAIQSERSLTIIPKMKQITIGEFKVIAFETEHDSKDPIGFLISHPEMGVLLFATDTYYLKYRFEGLTYIMIECNYSLDLLDANTDAGLIHPVVRSRTLRSHMSLQTAIDTLQANNLTHALGIILIHLSSQNSDSARFKTTIESATGKRVFIARKGLELIIDNTPF